MDGSDHRNHTVLVGVRRVRDINYKAGFTIVARLATYRQVHKYTGMNLPLIGRRVRRRARDPSSGRLQCPAAIKARRAWLVRSDSANAVKTHLRHLYATSARTAATGPYSAPGPSACSQGPPAGPRTPVGPAWGRSPPSRAVTASPGSGGAEDLANTNRRKVSSHDNCLSPGRSGFLEVCPEPGPPSRVMGHSRWPCPED